VVLFQATQGVRSGCGNLGQDAVTVGMAKVNDRHEREPEPATDQRGQPFDPDCPEPRVCRWGNLCLGSCKLFPALEPSSVSNAEVGSGGRPVNNRGHLTGDPPGSAEGPPCQL